MKETETYLRLSDEDKEIIKFVEGKTKKNYFTGDFININNFFTIICDLLFKITLLEEGKENEKSDKN